MKCLMGWKKLHLVHNFGLKSNEAPPSRHDVAYIQYRRMVRQMVGGPNKNQNMLNRVVSVHFYSQVVARTLSGHIFRGKKTFAMHLELANCLMDSGPSEG